MERGDVRVFSVLSGEWNVPEIIANQDFVILQFGTKSCTPCLALSRKLKSWGKEHADITVVYIPTEKYPEQSAQMGVLSSPTILTYINGQLQQRESGYFSLEQLLDQMEKLKERYKEPLT